MRSDVMRRRRASADDRRGPRWRPWLAGPFVLLAACGGGGDVGPADTDPAAAALRLFELAPADEPTDEQLRALFEPAPDDDGRAALLDALGALGTTTPRVVEVVQPAGPADAFVDLAARLPSGGEARFSVRLRAAEPGSWRVIWFQGPGVEWPPRSTRRGDGLSSSAPPGTAR
jgi:hypothetical protein